MFGKIVQLAKKSVCQAPAAAPEIAAQSKALFSSNLKQLEKFAATELPSAVSAQKAAWTGLEQLAKNARAMVK